MLDDKPGPKQQVDRERSEPSESPLVRFASDYAKIAKTTITTANRSLATTTELRSARGMCYGALAGIVVDIVLLALVGGLISPPIATLIVMVGAGIGWAEARYRGHIYMLPDTKRSLADEYYHIYSRTLRAIEDGQFPAEVAQAMREAAFEQYQAAMRSLNSPPPTESNDA